MNVRSRVVVAKHKKRRRRKNNAESLSEYLFDAVLSIIILWFVKLMLFG